METNENEGLLVVNDHLHPYGKAVDAFLAIWVVKKENKRKGSGMGRDCLKNRIWPSFLNDNLTQNDTFKSIFSKCPIHKTPSYYYTNKKPHRYLKFRITSCLIYFHKIKSHLVTFCK